MNIAFYSGASGLLAFQESLDVTGHNISNVSTAGYKKERATFEDLVYTRMAVNEENDHLVGHGVKNPQRDMMFGQGNVNQTNNPLDFMIVGDGFFALERQGQREYTRNGAFDLSVENDTAYLVTTDGAYVLDGDGNRIEVPAKTDGKGTVIPNSGYNIEGIKDKLGVYFFPNVYGLTPTNRSSFYENAVSGAAVAANPGNGQGNQDNAGAAQSYDLLQNSLEQSSVDLADEMVNMITAQRGYQFSSRLVQTADGLEDILNNLR